MAPPSYLHRHLLLSALLDRQQPPPPDNFALPGQTNQLGCKLDALLLRGWSTSARKAKPQDNDVLHNVDSLRLKKNDFDVLGRIGEGQFGVVDAVRCKLNGKVYALKSIEKHMAVRAGMQLGLPFERHVHQMAMESTTSPAPSLLTSFQSPNALHMVTEYAPCGSIWDRLCEMPPAPGLDTGRMGDGEVAWWARQMVDAISWIHGVGYAHRDIKPHNFLLLSDGQLWLTDFGSAAPLSSGKVARRYCMLPVGTPDYIAPEVLRISEDAMVEAAQSVHEGEEGEDGERTVRQSDVTASGYGPDVDWWSLGATLYEMAVGRAPFWAPTIGPTYERIMRCDLRLPEDLPPQFKSLLSGLLCLEDMRLSAGEIRRHSFFRDVDWSKKPSMPPPGVTISEIDLGTLAESFVHDYNDFTEATFEHFFNQTTYTASLSASVSRSVSMVVPESTWSRWVGWSWSPPADHFGPDAPVINVSPATRSSGLSGPSYPSGPRQSSAPPASMFTPMRPGLLHATPPTVPRTAPRSVPRTRPLPERQAFAELLRCVEDSAKKKLASTRPPSSVSSVSTAASPTAWRKQQPPTPTPMSRESSTLHATFVSKAGVPVPRPLSRTSSRTDLPSRPSSRTSGHSRQGSSQDFSLNPSSRSGSLKIRDDTFLAKLAAVDADKPRSPPVWDAVGRGAAQQATFKPEQRTNRRLTLESIKEVRSAPSFKDPSSEPTRPQAAQRAAPLAPITNAVRSRASSASTYVQPRHPGMVGDGSRLASLEVWHKSIESGLDHLERRLAELTARYSTA